MKEVKKEKKILSESLKDRNKASIIVIIAVALVGVCVCVSLFSSNKISDGRYKTEYQTTEANIEMPTAKEGKTEVSTDKYGNSFIVKEDGMYRQSDFGDGYEKVMQQKIVPLIGEWKSDNSGIVYKFNEDKTFCISIPYETENGDFAYLEYSGTANVRKNYDASLAKFGFEDMNALFSHMGIDSNSFVKENLYYLSLDYNKIVNSATGEEIQIDSTNTEDDIEGAEFDGLMYTYWLEDTNSYKMKVCSISDKITYTFVRQ